MAEPSFRRYPGSLVGAERNVTSFDIDVNTTRQGLYRLMEFQGFTIVSISVDF